MRPIRLATALAALCTAVPACAQTAARTPDSGDGAWILISSALVLLMTMPGLSLFYGGLVRAKNALSVMVQVGAIAAVASLLWVVCGYTMAFGTVSNGWLGGGNALMLAGLAKARAGYALPENTYALFQLCFAAITPALMVGA